MRMYVKRRLRIVGNKRLFKKEKKGFLNPPFIAMRRFCGLPIGLKTLPIVIENASVKSKKDVLILCFLERSIRTGVPMIAMVSFIRIADRKPNMKRMERINWSIDFVLLNNL